MTPCARRSGLHHQLRTPLARLRPHWAWQLQPECARPPLQRWAGATAHLTQHSTASYDWSAAAQPSGSLLRLRTKKESSRGLRPSSAAFRPWPTTCAQRTGKRAVRESGSENNDGRTCVMASRNRTRRCGAMTRRHTFALPGHPVLLRTPTRKAVRTATSGAWPEAPWPPCPAVRPSPVPYLAVLHLRRQVRHPAAAQVLQGKGTPWQRRRPIATVTSCPSRPTPSASPTEYVTLV